jgi:DNA polymerase-3 subunit alpha
MSFVHLRLHTEYSLVDSTIRIKQLVPAVEAGGMPAVAMTDQNNMFGIVKFYRAAMAQGLKPIFGVDVLLEDEEDEGLLYHMILLCQNNTGYHNITKLISRAYQEGQKLGIPRVQRHWIKETSEGVIALSGGRDGDVGYALLADNTELASKRVQHWASVFPDRYYIELQRTGRSNEDDYLRAAVDLAMAHNLPVVATNDSRFLKTDEFDAHEARVCIHGGYTLGDKTREKIYSKQQYLRTAEEMTALFSDIPTAIENTLEIAKRCNVTLTLGKNYLPEFPIPEGMTEAEFFSQESEKGLELRLKELFDTEADDFSKIRKPFDERLKIELDVINGMGFPGYFLIVADFIQWAKDNDIPVGPGRGSGAGSLVAFALKITDIEPLKYELLFERFLNPERISMPDFDIDFCMDKRDLVIDYVARTYGRDKVSQIITYGSMAAKAVVRDVGRILSQPYGFVDRIAKLIPFEMKMTLTKALKDSPDLKELYDENEDVKELINLALSLEGLTRNVGKHAGGVLISPSTLVDFTPLYCEEGGGSVVSQFDKDDVEAVGLVKFDFLGLRNLTIIDWAVKTVNKQRAKEKKEPINISTIPLDDKKAFELLRAAKTTAVFQLESRGMKELILRLAPDVFEDIIALVALYRPGPLQSGMVDDFVNRKKGLAEVSYPHPALEKILEPTYGVIVYQEQVMQIAQILAGYSLGGADMLRRAMGKKKAEEMDKQRAIFMEGAIKNKVEEKNATEIFDLMALFAEYGFNKCLTGDSKIYAFDSGKQITLKDAYQQGLSSVASLQSNDKMGKGQVIDIMENGVKPVFNLTTMLGKNLSATDNHPFLTLEGWKQLGELKIGDRIATPAFLPIEGNVSWSDHKLIVLGWILAEINCYHPLEKCFFYHKNDTAIDDFVIAVQQFENQDDRCNVWRVFLKASGEQLPAHWRTTKTYPETKAHSEVKLWLESLNLQDKSSSNKCLPACIFELNNQSLAILIGRFWASDGFIADNATNTENNTPYLVNDSKQLLQQFSHLLLRFGIVTQLNKTIFKHKRQGYTGYTLHLFGQHSIERFITVFEQHLVSREKELSLLKDYLQNKAQDKASTDTLPTEVKHYFQAGKEKAEIFWDRIESIEPIGEEMTYDLEIAKTHNFVANDIIVHNSHSAAYALVSYQTIWLKAHYPAAFMAAVLSADMDNTDKVVTFVDDCRQSGLDVVAPDVNRSQYRFSTENEGNIVFGLGAIKGAGESALGVILEERDKKGTFKSMADLCERVASRKVTKRILETLIKAGAFDSLGKNRHSLLEHLPEVLRMANQKHRADAVGQVDLFGGSMVVEEDEKLAPNLPEWEERERLRLEKNALGLYLTGHPINEYEDEIKQFCKHKLSDLADDDGTQKYQKKPVILAGIVSAIRTQNTEKGKRAFVQLDDKTAYYEVFIFSNVYEEFEDLIQKEEVLVIEGSLNTDFSGNMRLRINVLHDIASARKTFARHLQLSVNQSQIDTNLVERLGELLPQQKEASCPVFIHYETDKATAQIRLGKSVNAPLSDDALQALRKELGDKGVRVCY